MDYHHLRIAEIYDLINPLADDAGFYLALAGEHPQDVLDLGCGTGTLCCALAERGHHVTGVDPAAAMLSVARRKLRADHVEWIQSPAQTFRANRSFDLIVMTGHAFQVLLTDADALAVFETMRVHLKDQDRIAFETRNPRVDWARQWSSRPPAIYRLPDGGLQETLEITAAHGEFIAFKTTYRLAHETLTTTSTLRFPSREQVQALLTRSGLAVRKCLGDWAGRDFDPARSKEIILIAERAGASTSFHHP